MPFSRSLFQHTIEAGNSEANKRLIEMVKAIAACASSNGYCSPCFWFQKQKVMTKSERRKRKKEREEMVPHLEETNLNKDCIHTEGERQEGDGHRPPMICVVDQLF